MSTETTNKKIKIDNGTTFGKTYTDKAVDELLKNVGGRIGTLNVYAAENGFEYPDLTNVEKGIYIVNVITSHTDPTILSSGFGYVDNSDTFGGKTLSLIISLPDSQIYSFFNGNQIFGGNPIVRPNSFHDKNIMIYDSNNNSFITLDAQTSNGFLYYDVNHLDTNNGYSWREITLSKTISLFGKHSILVPKNSADTAIDLYIHNIVLKDNAETTTKKIYLTVQSTTNTPSTTKELLQTLLGSTSRYIRVSGYTPTNDISAINWTGTFDTSKYDVRGTETSLTDFTVIEDSVVTLK